MSSQYNKLTDSLISQFKEIVGENSFFDSYEIRWTYSFGGTIFEKEWIPDLILLPENKEEVSRILKLANENNIPITPRTRNNVPDVTNNPFLIESLI